MDNMPKEHQHHRFNTPRPPYQRKSKQCLNCKAYNLHYNRYCICCGSNVQMHDSIFCYHCQQGQSAFNKYCWACGQLTTPIGEKPVYAAPLIRRTSAQTTRPTTTTTTTTTTPENTKQEEPASATTEAEVFSETVQEWADMD